MLRLDDHLCFAIYSTAHMFNRLYGPHLDALGLTYPQYLVMVVLWDEDGQRVGTLSETLKLEPSTLTPILKRLEKRGLIRRERDRDDERVVNIALTASGRRLAAKVHPVNRAIADAIGKSDTDRKRVMQDLIDVRDSLEHALAELA